MKSVWQVFYMLLRLIATIEPLHNGHLGDRRIESGHCRELAVVERLKNEWMYGLSAKKMAVLERWPLVEVQLY